MKARLIGPSVIDILGIVKGLKSSGDLVEENLKDESYDTIMLSITEEEVNGLREFMGHPYQLEMDDIEIIYEYHMRHFGETSIPPEGFMRAIEKGDANGSSVLGIDIPSGKYEELFVDNVTLFDLIRLSLIEKRLIRRRWNYSDPEKFSIQWDQVVNRKGYRKLEDSREEYMANEISKKKGNKNLVIIDVERVNGVVSHLQTLLPEYKLQQS